MKEKNKFDPLIISVFIVMVLAYTLIFTVPLIQEIGPKRTRGPEEAAFRGVAWFNFDQSNALKQWEERIFKGRVLYSIKKDKLGGYLNAYSKGSASAIIYWLKFDPIEKKMVSWKWRVTRFPEKEKNGYEESSWIEKEDYAARFYIIFPKFPFFRIKCLEYIWDKDKPVGTILTNPNFNNLKLIVVESGRKRLGEWLHIERNVYEDFIKAFGRRPPRAGAIAIMTDTENTGSTAEAQYDDIKVGYGK